jgi:SsrA-binding protein
MEKKDKKPSNDVNVKNRKAFYDFAITDKYQAGIQLLGTEIKSIRLGHVTLRDAYCYFDNGELFVKNLKIEPLKDAATNNHDPERPKKLLLKKTELAQISKEVDKGMSVIATKLFTNDRGLAKLEISLAKGKKQYDKRESIKKKDIEREMQRKDS